MPICICICSMAGVIVAAMPGDIALYNAAGFPMLAIV